MCRFLRALSAAFVLAATWVASASELEAHVKESLAYAGNYRVSGDRLIGIDPFVMDDGTNALLISDYASGVVRRLFPVSKSEFVMGAGFNAASPVELTVRFALDKAGNSKSIHLRYADGTQNSGDRVALKREELTFQGAKARLAGTLIIPPTKGPRPAIILLHGSGPLTRYSFGPYPHFFSSLGFAVLIYDKRGTGSSTGRPNRCVHWRSDDEFALSGRSCGRCARRDAVASAAQGHRSAQDWVLGIERRRNAGDPSRGSFSRGRVRDQLFRLHGAFVEDIALPGRGDPGCCRRFASEDRKEVRIRRTMVAMSRVPARLAGISARLNSASSSPTVPGSSNPEGRSHRSSNCVGTGITYSRSIRPWRCSECSVRCSACSANWTRSLQQREPRRTCAACSRKPVTRISRSGSSRRQVTRFRNCPRRIGWRLACSKLCDRGCWRMRSPRRYPKRNASDAVSPIRARARRASYSTSAFTAFASSCARLRGPRSKNSKLRPKTKV